jgi:hypothetical protein
VTVAATTRVKLAQLDALFNCRRVALDRCLVHYAHYRLADAFEI